MLKASFALSLSFIMGSASVALAQSMESTVETAQETDAVSEVADHLIGILDTSAQAALNSNFVSVQITTCQIAIDNPLPGSIYLYQEQALSEQLDQPYRQRFLQVVGSDDPQQVESRTYKPDSPELWTGLCTQPDRRVNSNALGTPVCTVFLRPSSLGYVGSTPREGCLVNVRGAVRLTNVVVLHSEGMDTWDRGFDENGIQVWGAQGEPYRYRWAN